MLQTSNEAIPLISIQFSRFGIKCDLRFLIVEIHYLVFSNTDHGFSKQYCQIFLISNCQISLRKSPRTAQVLIDRYDWKKKLRNRVFGLIEQGCVDSNPSSRAFFFLNQIANHWRKFRVKLIFCLVMISHPYASNSRILFLSQSTVALSG